MKASPCKECGVSTLYMSWSSLRVAEECKQKGHLYRSGKRADLANNRVFFPGTVVDRVMRDWLMNDPEDNLGRMPEMIASIMEREEAAIKDSGGKMTWKDSEDRKAVTELCTTAAKKLEPHLIDLVLPKLYQPAMRFQAPLWITALDGSMERIVLRGEFDLLLQDPDTEEFEVWDLKITKDDNYWRKTIGQLTFYDISVFLMTGQYPRRNGLIQPLCKREILPYTPTSLDRMQMMQRIQSFAESQWREDFTPRKDNSICNFCDVKHACSKFKPVNVGKGRQMNLFGSK